MFKVEQRGEILIVDFLNVRVESGEAFIATPYVSKLKPTICENVTRFSLPTSQIMSLRPAFFNPNTIFFSLALVSVSQTVFSFVKWG